VGGLIPPVGRSAARAGGWFGRGGSSVRVQRTAGTRAAVRGRLGQSAGPWSLIGSGSVDANGSRRRRPRQETLSRASVPRGTRARPSRPSVLVWSGGAGPTSRDESGNAAARSPARVTWGGGDQRHRLTGGCTRRQRAGIVRGRPRPTAGGWPLVGVGVAAPSPTRRARWCVERLRRLSGCPRPERTRAAAGEPRRSAD
jgi:hypothetical protein